MMAGGHDIYLHDDLSDQTYCTVHKRSRSYLTGLYFPGLYSHSNGT